MFKNIFFTISFLIFSYSNAQNTQSISNEPTLLFSEAEEYVFLDKYSAGYEAFTLFAKKYPNDIRNIDAKYFSAFCALNLNYTSAEKLMQKFVIDYPNHPKTVFANYEIGSYFFRKKNYTKTIEYLSEVDLSVLNESTKLECNFKLAYAYLNTKSFDKSATVFHRIKTSKNKYQFAANYYLGFINYKKENYSESENYLKKAAENEAYTNVVPTLLANVFLKQKKYDSVIVYSEKQFANGLNPKGNEELYLILAEAHYQKKNWVETVNAFDKYFLSGLPTSELVLFKYGVAKFKTEDYPKAIQVLKKTAEKNDTIGQNSAYYLGMSWLKMENKLFAYNAFNQSRKMQFNKNISNQSTLEYVKIGLEMEKYADILSACKEYFSKNEDGSIVHNEINDVLSEVYLHTNDYATAIKHIENLKSKSGNTNRTYQLVTYYYGLEQFNQEKYQTSIESLEKTVANDYDRETTVSAHYYLAESYVLNKNPEKAEDHYLKVTRHTAKVKPEIFARSFYGLGYIYFNKKEYSKALIHFKDYTDEAKNETNKTILNDGYIRYADCLYAAKKLNLALEFYDKPIANNAVFDLDYCYLQKGIILAALYKNEEAKSKLNIILQNYPTSNYYDDALYNFGLIDFENTNYNSAVTVFTNIINAKKSSIYVPLALQKRAIAMYNMKNYELSAQDYQTLLSDFPTHKATSSAVLGLQEALTQLGKTEKMDTLLQAYKNQNPNDENIKKIEFENAKNLYFEQKYADAISKLTKYILDYPTSIYTSDATYFLADAYLKTNDKINAKTQFQINVKSESGNFYNKSVQKLAEIELEEKNYELSKKQYQKFAQIAANKKELTNAWAGLMQNYFELKQYDSSSHFANQILTNGSPSAAIANKSLLFLGKNALADQKDNAKDFLISCLNQATDQSGAEASYILANELFEDNDYKNSLEILFDLTKKYNYPKWIDKSYSLIADNYIKMNELYQAKATLLSIIEKSKDTQIIEIAKQKLEKIENQ